MVLGAAEAAKIEMIKGSRKPIMDWISTRFSLWNGYYVVYKHYDIFGAVDWYFKNMTRRRVMMDYQGSWIYIKGTLMSNSNVYRFYFKTKEDATAFKILWS